MSGIQASISGEEKADLTLQYANTVLDAPGASAPGLTPADCVPYMLYDLRSSTPTETSSETVDGESLILLRYEDPAQESGIVRLIWLDEDTHALIFAEVYADGQRILQCSFSDWASASENTDT